MKIHTDHITDNSVYTHELFPSFFCELKNIEEHFQDNLLVNYIVHNEKSYIIHRLGIFEYLRWLQGNKNASYSKEFQSMTKKTFDKIEK